MKSGEEKKTVARGERKKKEKRDKKKRKIRRVYFIDN